LHPGTPDEGPAETRVALLLDREAASRGTRRYRTRLRAANLRHGQAAIEDVDYRTQRRLDKVLFQHLTTCRWIAEARNLLVTGKCGVGKSSLSCALAQKGLPRRVQPILRACAPSVRRDSLLHFGQVNNWVPVSLLPSTERQRETDICHV
jgi:hypothetical protein